LEEALDVSSDRILIELNIYMHIFTVVVSACSDALQVIHNAQTQAPTRGETDSIPTKPAASFRCNRFLVRVFLLVLRTRECLSPFATKRTNGVEGSSCTSDSHRLILIAPFSYVSFHSVVLFSL
jgi:hypothetical protein